MVGAVRESPPSVKGGLIGTLIATFLLLGIVGYAFVLMGDIEKGGRAAYIKLPNKDKAAVEKRLECCGWDDPNADHSPECRGKHTCDKPMGKELKKTAFMRLLIPAAALIVQAFVLFSVGCYYRKLSKHIRPKIDKSISLVEEARLRKEGKSLEPTRKSRLKKREERKAARKAQKSKK
jgi:hypothetical protein